MIKGAFDCCIFGFDKTSQTKINLIPPCTILAAYHGLIFGLSEDMYFERSINYKAEATGQHKTPDQIVNFTKCFTD